VSRRYLVGVLEVLDGVWRFLTAVLGIFDGCHGDICSVFGRYMMGVLVKFDGCLRHI